MEIPRTPFHLPAPRDALVKIGQREAALRLQAEANKAGPDIEKYLSVFRDALNANAETDRYSDHGTGYDWCCAFVYWCCREAGFRFPPKPLPGARYTLAAVPAWQEWAMAEGCYHPAGTFAPKPGDIVLFDRLVSDSPLDHIGIVIDVTQPYLLCAEGNVEDRTGLHQRSYSKVAGYIRLPQITFRDGRFMTTLIASIILASVLVASLGKITGRDSIWQSVAGGVSLNLPMLLYIVINRIYTKGRLPWLEDHR